MPQNGVSFNKEYSKCPAVWVYRQNYYARIACASNVLYTKPVRVCAVDWGSRVRVTITKRAFANRFLLHTTRSKHIVVWLFQHNYYFDNCIPVCLSLVLMGEDFFSNIF